MEGGGGVREEVNVFSLFVLTMTKTDNMETHTHIYTQTTDTPADPCTFVSLCFWGPVYI